MKWLAAVWWRLVRFGFRLLYNEMAWTYDTVSKVVSLGQWRDWQRVALRYLDPPSDGVVLELAHGTGDLQIDLAEAGYRSVGLDRSRRMGRIARRKLRTHGIGANLVRGDARRLPFPGNFFGAVTSTFPTEFIVHPDTLAEAHRVLAPGGRFVVVVNGFLTGKNPSAEALEWLYRVTGQRGPWPEDALDLLRDAGFEPQVITERLPHSAVLMVVGEKSSLSDPAGS
jgi:ubiquinone/menaquinone biosynthesis C-methylase UbiE